MAHSPLVSVIVPNYNHARFLKRRLDSVVSQTFKDFELIILDDCSTDDSRTVIEEYRSFSKVSVINYNTINSGSPFHQWEKGVRLACGEWIWIAESDDWADDSFLDYMLKEAERHPDCGLVYSLPKNFDKWLKPSEKIGPKAFAGSCFIGMLADNNVIPNVSGIIFKRDLFLSIDTSLFRDLKLCGDWFCYTLLSEKTNVLYCPMPHSYFRCHESNSSSNSVFMGLDFFEGIRVLEYIQSRYPFSRIRAYRKRGERLAYCRAAYGLDREVNRKICRVCKDKYPCILLWAKVFGMKLWISSHIVRG